AQCKLNCKLSLAAGIIGQAGPGKGLLSRRAAGDMGSVWAECLDDKGEPFKSFTDFVEAPLPEGLRSTIEKLERYCFENQEVVPMIRAEIPPRQKLGTNQHTLGSDGIRPSDRNAGTGRVVTIARLKADPKHADLAARVVSGE